MRRTPTGTGELVSEGLRDSLSTAVDVVALLSMVEDGDIDFESPRAGIACAPDDLS